MTENRAKKQRKKLLMAEGLRIGNRYIFLFL